MRSITAYIYGILYPVYIGQIEVNLRSLDVLLRTFISIEEKTLERTIEFAKNLRELKNDQEVDENAFTKPYSFTQLVVEYNKKVKSSPLYDGLKIDYSLIGFRNALAHGLAFYKEQFPPFTKMFLVKFSDAIYYENTNKIKVEFQKDMTFGWLSKKRNWVQGEYEKVKKACRIIEKQRPN